MVIIDSLYEMACMAYGLFLFLFGKKKTLQTGHSKLIYGLKLVLELLKKLSLGK